MFCNQEKAWLSQKGVAFTVKDVATDEEALAELEALGAFSTPVTVIDGEAVIGFNRKRLEELLGFAS
ncbi:MAG: glutaredoxin family protein [Chloroflexi bacterium]|nr:glutaredoxin family protein [Chloroflexota bacterium]